MLVKICNASANAEKGIFPSESFHRHVLADCKDIAAVGTVFCDPLSVVLYGKLCFPDTGGYA